MCAEGEKRFLASTKRDAAFISRGFTYWRDAIVSFRTHAASACHKEAVQSDQLPKEMGDVAERLVAGHTADKERNRSMFMRILQNIRFLARQGLALRGSGDGEDSNFIQLLRLREFDCPAVAEWMSKKTNKYTSGDVQNEVLQIMALNILRDVAASIKTSGWYTIMADECTDVSNKEQFVICIRWVDTDLCDHEDIIGLHQVNGIDSSTLVATIQDVLLRLGLSISMCRGQCYDGAANMSGSRGGVSARLQEKEPRAVLTHCYGHALNLAVGDCIKKSTICRDALDVSFEIAKLLRFSPKRAATFDRIRVEDPMEDNAPSQGIRAFCPTRWTVRGDALESILDHWATLSLLWEECLETRLDPDVKARIIGVKAQMNSFSLLFGVHLSKTILQITDNLSRSLQKESRSAAEGQGIAALSLETLKACRSDEAFESFYSRVEVSRKKLDVSPACLPRKRKAPAHFEIGSGAGSHPESAMDLYRQKYFEALDLVIESIKIRFHQPGYQLYSHLEQLIVLAANGKEYAQHVEAVCKFYGNDLDSSLLRTQLDSLKCYFNTRESTTIVEVIAGIRSMSPVQRSFFSEVCSVTRLVLVMPATNAASERSFSCMRRLKTYLRGTMHQSRLNHVMLLSINKDHVDSLDLNAIGEEFIRGSEHRLRQLGHFQ